jgi:hypothetical protein
VSELRINGIITSAGGGGVRVLVVLRVGRDERAGGARVVEGGQMVRARSILRVLHTVAVDFS